MLGVIKKLFAGAGQAKHPVAPVDQFDPQFCFQYGNPAGDG